MTVERGQPQPHLEPHRCFGCNEEIGAYEPHIHVPMDDFAARDGLSPLGMDDVFTFAFCQPCTQRSEDGWQMERHA